jgi:hypothetical protein
MFKRKNLLVAVAVSALLAACGGGSDSPASTSAGGSSSTASGNTAAAASALRGSLKNIGDNIEFSNVAIQTSQLADTATFPDGVGPFTRGTSAPVSNFGFRVQPQGMEGNAAQTTKASFAIDLAERAGTAGIAAGEQAEALQVLVDNVSVTANADGSFSLADVAGSKVYVYFKPATGAAVNASASATGLVKVAADPNDPTSAWLTIDLDKAISNAAGASTGTTATTLGKIKDMTGSFDFKSVVSNVGMTKADGTPLTGTAITVTNAGQTTAAGGGAAGRIQFQ